MRCFLYFVKGSQPPFLDQVRAWGLGYAFSSGLGTRQTAIGPKGTAAGHLFWEDSRLGETQPRLDNETQEWRIIPGRKGQQEIWIGYEREAPPQPADLERPDMLSGFLLKVADGRPWTVPVVRALDVTSGDPVCLLPTFTDLDEEGRRVPGAVKETYKWLWELTERAWQAMLAGDDVPEDELLPVVAGIFQANYFVDAIELHLMNVFDQQTFTPASIIALAIDFQTFLGWSNSQKKTNPDSTDDGCTTTAGNAA
jgi:hypothetical protein